MTDGYSELPDGRVHLTMSRDDYESVLLALGYMVGGAMKESVPERARYYIALANRLNAGNPHFTPYEVPEETESAK